MEKILIYFNSMHPAGGIERVIATLSDKLSVKYDITILVKDEPNSFYKLNDSVKIVTLNNELKFNMHNRVSRIFAAFKNVLRNSAKLKAYLRSNHYDFYYLAHPLSVLEFSLAGSDMSKILITEHGAKSAYNRVYNLIKNVLYKKCRTYIVPTKTDTELYIRDGMPAVCIPHFRSNLPYTLASKKNKRVLNVGRFTPDKQQDILLKIWSNIIYKRGCKDWTLDIVGSGELEKELKELVAKYKLQEFVKFNATTKSIETFYETASVFALTSVSEGFGMVLLEAISFGIPCVSFDCPSGPRDIIRNNLNGYLVPLNDSGKFESKLYELIQNENLITEMGDYAYLESNNWSDKVILEKWFKILS